MRCAMTCANTSSSISTTRRRVLVVGETGDVKKGARTVGGQRQYTGPVSRIENSEVAVYLVYASARGHTAVDRELYIPRTWAADPSAARRPGWSQTAEPH